MGLSTLYTGFATGIVLLAVVLLIDGVTTGSTLALHQPLLMDSYPPAARVRVFSAYRAFDSFGNVLAPLLVALLAGPLGYTWRGVFLVFGFVCLAVLPCRLGLERPRLRPFRHPAGAREAVHEDDEALADGGRLARASSRSSAGCC